MTKERKMPELPRELSEVLDFLYGAESMDGKWYGEDPPKGCGRYWWRSKLRLAIESAVESIQREAWNAALEAAAKVCSQYSSERWDAYKHGDMSSFERANPYVEGKSDGADECEDLIRSLRKE